MMRLTGFNKISVVLVGVILVSVCSMCWGEDAFVYTAIEKQVGELERGLTGELAVLELGVDYLKGDFVLAYRNALKERLDEMEPLAESLKVLVAVELERMDGYDGDDWQEKYGATGIYEQVEQLSRRIGLCELLVGYYRGVEKGGQESVYERVQSIGQFLGAVQDDRFEYWLKWAAAAKGHDKTLAGFRDGIHKAIERKKLEGNFAEALKLELLAWRCWGGNVKALQGHLETVLGYGEKAGWVQLVNRYVVGTLDEQLNLAGGANGFVKVWDGDSVRRLGQYLANDKGDYVQAIGLYEAYLRVCAMDDRLMGDVLYDLAMARWYYGMSLRDAKDQEGWQRELATAVKTLGYLVKTYPEWQSVDRGEELASEDVAKFAAVEGMRLIYHDDLRYRAVGDAAIEGYMGKLEGEEGEVRFVGRYAETDGAKEMRFQYGNLLMSKDDFAKAETVYGLVPRDGEHGGEGMYYHVLAGYMAAGGDESAEVRGEWVDELEAITKEEGVGYDDVSLNVNVGKLLGDMGWKLGEGQRVYEGLMRVVEKVLSGDELTADDVVVGLIRYATATLQDGISLRQEMMSKGEFEKAEGVARAGARLAEMIVYKRYDFAEEEKVHCRAMLFELYGVAMLATAEQGAGDQLSVLKGKVERLEATMDELYGAERVKSLEEMRGVAMARFAEGNYTMSQWQWYQVRKGLEQRVGDDSDKVYGQWGANWWEARYYGMRCLYEMGQTEEAVHAVEVLLKSEGETVGEGNGWIERMENSF